METQSTCSEMGSIPRRRRPLHTSAASFISIATTAYQKAENLNTPLLNKMTGAASLASPLILTSQSLLLTLLSIFDDWIVLPVEGLMEFVFPPWKYLFDKVDEMVGMVQSLPGKFENAVDKFPDRVPMLDIIIFWLKLCISELNDCGDSVKEKEIVVVENYNEATTEGQGTDQRDFPPVGSCQGEIKDDFVPLPPASQKAVSAGSDSEGTKSEAGSPKPSYKEALEKGSKESSPKNKEETIKGSGAIAEAGVVGGESHNKDDEILALLESAWLMMPSPKKGNDDDDMTRSASYHL